jgi:hypothetical protein
MLKKTLLTALFALYVLAAAGTQAAQPPPECDPCPWVN